MQARDSDFVRSGVRGVGPKTAVALLEYLAEHPDAAPDGDLAAWLAGQGIRGLNADTAARIAERFDDIAALRSATPEDAAGRGAEPDRWGWSYRRRAYPGLLRPGA
jgi:5'-3' exonuclease